jgi:hypothetical protein
MKEIIIAPDGRVRTIYSDDLAGLLHGLGDVRTTRASHVEPCPGGWCADLAPVDGPVLGPFALRSKALEAETAWLLAHDTPEPKEEN